nr:hypothetical protein [Tanacetum cinerariifolium]
MIPGSFPQRGGRKIRQPTIRLHVTIYKKYIKKDDEFGSFYTTTSIEYMNRKKKNMKASFSNLPAGEVMVVF